MTKRTRGKWIVDPLNSTRVRTAAGGSGLGAGRTIALTSAYVGPPASSVENEGNALLLAHAPDLLSALKALATKPTKAARARALRLISRIEDK